MKTTLSVYECGEFHNLGKSFIGIESAEEAVRLWESIPACNLNGIKAINICTEDDHGEEIEDFEVIYGGVMHLESVTDILSDSDWLDKLDRYINPNGLRYVQDMSVFSKAPAEQWLNNIKKASSRDIDDFRGILRDLYPNSVRRESYFEDADTIKAIIEGLKKMEEEDLIKKACTGWLCAQFEAIVKSHEPQVEQETE